MGERYYNGVGVGTNFTEALKWFRALAEQGKPKAQYFLGRMYGLGQGVATNHQESFAWSLKSAQQAHARAQCNVGALYASGLGVDTDYTEAVKWYRDEPDSSALSQPLADPTSAFC